MYKEKEKHDLEEMYVLGHRLLSFLSMHLPRHPDFSKPRSWNLRNKSRREAKTLEFCLEDLAVSIDELHCNQVVDFSHEFDVFLSQDKLRQHKTKDDSLGENWVPFGGWRSEKESSNVDSPDTTLNTTGSESLEPSDTSSSDDCDGFDGHEVVNSDNAGFYSEKDDEEQRGKILFTLDFSESSDEDEFLYQVANEYVPFDVDSDGSDSWAQDSRSHSLSFSSYKTGNSPTCDPAEIVFRHIMFPTSGKTETCEGDLKPSFTVQRVNEALTQAQRKRTTLDPEGKRLNEPAMPFDDSYSASIMAQETPPGSTRAVVRQEVTFQEFNLGLLEIDDWISFDGEENQSTKPFSSRIG